MIYAQVLPDLPMDSFGEQNNYVGVIIARSKKLSHIIQTGGNLCISVALNIQKYVHNKIADKELEPLLLESEEYESQIVEPVYYKESLWWLGQFMITVGEIGNFVAYGFSSAILVAPLGTVALVY